MDWKYTRSAFYPHHRISRIYCRERDTAIHFPVIGKGTPFRWKPDYGNSCAGREPALRIPWGRIPENLREQCTLSRWGPIYSLPSLITPHVPLPLWGQTMALSANRDWTGGMEERKEEPLAIIHSGSGGQALMDHFCLCWWIGVTVLPFSENLFFSCDFSFA